MAQNEIKVESPKSRRDAAIKAWVTRHGRMRQQRATESGAASKRAIKTWCAENNWKLVFFEGPTGAPRTGVRCGCRQKPSLDGLHVWPISGFEKQLLFYRPTDHGIDVIRVLHGARDLERLFEEDE